MPEIFSPLPQPGPGPNPSGEGNPADRSLRLGPADTDPSIASVPPFLWPPAELDRKLENNKWKQTNKRFIQGHIAKQCDTECSKLLPFTIIID